MDGAVLNVMIMICILPLLSYLLHLNITTLLGIIKRKRNLTDYIERIRGEKGLAGTIYEARQKIVHGHIQVKDKKIDAPSYIVKKEEEDLISFTAKSPFKSK